MERLPNARRKLSWDIGSFRRATLWHLAVMEQHGIAQILSFH
jgi:hypothetical protein